MAAIDTCANRIREGLRIRDMSQAELCRITGIPKSAMSQYCNDLMKPRQKRIFLIATALNVSEAWIMGFDVPIERKTSPASIEEDGRIKEFISLFAKLTAEQQALVISQIKGILTDQ